MEPTQTAPPSPDPAFGDRRIAPGHARCRARKRCRLHFDPASGLCPRHALRPPDTMGAPEDCDLSDFFFCPTDQFDSASQINYFLSTVVDLVIKNEISARRAAVLAYITNQLLRTLPIIQQENPPQFIFDLPRPKPTLEERRADPKSPEAASLKYYESLAP